VQQPTFLFIQRVRALNVAGFDEALFETTIRLLPTFSDEDPPAEEEDDDEEDDCTGAAAAFLAPPGSLIFLLKAEQISFFVITAFASEINSAC
jgi:hypothetical protein